MDTPFVVQLDSDDWLPSGALDILTSAASELPTVVGVIHGNMKIVNENLDSDSDSTPKHAIKKGRQYTDRYDFLLSNSSVWPCFYRTRALRRIGGWPTDDPYEGRYLEDKRILFRMIEGYRFHWIDEVLYVHRRQDYNQTDNKVEIYRHITGWNIRDTLKRWGDHREPILRVDEYGWLFIDGFKMSKSDRTDSFSEKLSVLVEQVDYSNRIDISPILLDLICGFCPYRVE